MRRAIAASAVLALVAAALVTVWFLAWRDHPTGDLAATTSSTTTAPPTTTNTTTSPPTSTTTTAPPADSPNRVDLIGVVVAVERGPGWDTAPTGNCPDPGRGPHPEECPLIGPATLVLDDGRRLEVPAGTPGGHFLWNMTKRVNPPRITSRQAVIAAALADDGTVEWVYVLRDYVRPRDELPFHIQPTGGEITSLTPDGWVVTESGWEYRLADDIRTTGCSYLWGFTWGLAGPSPAPTTVHRTSPAELRNLWDGPQATRLTIGLLDYATTGTIDELECSDFLRRYRDPDPLGTLAQARVLWEAAGITDYRFRYETGGAWGPWGGIWDVTVQGGEGTAVIVEQGFSHEPPPPTSVADLFDMIEEDLTSPPSWDCDDPQYLTVLYDPALGYPTSLYLDHPRCWDEEHGWFIEDFAES